MPFAFCQGLCSNLIFLLRLLPLLLLLLLLPCADDCRSSERSDKAFKWAANLVIYSLESSHLCRAALKLSHLGFYAMRTHFRSFSSILHSSYKLACITKVIRIIKSLDQVECAVKATQKSVLGICFEHCWHVRKYVWFCDLLGMLDFVFARFWGTAASENDNQSTKLCRSRQ